MLKKRVSNLAAFIIMVRMSYEIQSSEYLTTAFDSLMNQSSQQRAAMVAEGRATKRMLFEFMGIDELQHKA